MGGNRQGAIRDASQGGVAGEHSDADPLQFLVGTTTTDQLNTLTLRLIPIACWRVDDIRFAFDSSFVNVDSSADSASTPSDIRAELKHLSKLVKDHPACPLSVFGHADPVGSDDYNKALSGRRAMAVYALLIFNSEPGTAVGIWQQISSTEHWGKDQRQTMEAFTGLPQGTADSALFRSYMQKLCPSDLLLTKKDFLAQGADSGNKGDVQGCSEFNPLLIFSQKKEAKFEKAKQKSNAKGISARDAANAPNRRVVILMFRKGSRVDPTRWPCPRTSEGIAGCKKRFWSNGETRRSERLPDKPREFANTEDTFACRFYQRLLTLSPCERLSRLIAIRLLYEDNTAMAYADFDAIFDGQTITGKTDKDGWATIDAPADGPESFRLMLKAFPERYTDSGGDTAVASRDDSVDSKAWWPHNVLTCFLLFACLLHFPQLFRPRCRSMIFRWLAMDGARQRPLQWSVARTSACTLTSFIQ